MSKLDFYLEFNLKGYLQNGNDKRERERKKQESYGILLCSEGLFIYSLTPSTLLEKFEAFFLGKPGGFQLSALARGGFEPSYACVNFFPPGNSVS